MEPILRTFRNFPRLFPVGLQQIHVAGQEIKNRTTRLWQRTAASFQQTEFWRISIKPIYARYLKPLEKLDCFLLLGSVTGTIVITFVITPAFFGTAMIPLGLALGGSSIPLTLKFINQRVDYYFGKKAQPKVEKIRVAVHAMSHTNRVFDAVQTAREELKKAKFKDLPSVNWDELDQKLESLKRIAVNDNPAKTATTLEEEKKALIVYLESLIKRLNPHHSSSALMPGSIQVSDQVIL